MYITKTKVFHKKSISQKKVSKKRYLNKKYLTSYTKMPACCPLSDLFPHQVKCHHDIFMEH